FAKYRWIDAVSVIRRPDHKKIMMLFQLADKTASLLDQLNVVLALKTDVSREETVYLVDNNDRRAVVFGTSKQVRQSLHRSASGTPKNISRCNGIDAE